MEYPANFYKASDVLACSGQPTEEQLGKLSIQQYQVIVNLGLIGTDYSLANEAESVARLGMEYLHIPVEFNGPSVSDLASFIQYMDKHTGKRTLVHCAANYRGACFTGLYLYHLSAINEDQMRDMIGNVWQPNIRWESFLEDGINYINDLKNS